MSVTLTNALEALSGDIIINGKMHTTDGGIASQYKNNTGATSVKGTIVQLDTTEDEAVIISPAGSDMLMGVMYSAGVADEGTVWVVTIDDAYVLLEDSTAATAGYWVKMSDTQDGRADATNASPPGGTISALEDHMTETGHAEESVTAGTDKLCKVHMHHN